MKRISTLIALTALAAVLGVSAAVVPGKSHDAAAYRPGSAKLDAAGYRPDVADPSLVVAMPRIRW